MLGHALVPLGRLHPAQLPAVQHGACQQPPRQKYEWLPSEGQLLNTRSARDTHQHCASNVVCRRCTRCAAVAHRPLLCTHLSTPQQATWSSSRPWWRQRSTPWARPRNTKVRLLLTQCAGAALSAHTAPLCQVESPACRPLVQHPAALPLASHTDKLLQTKLREKEVKEALKAERQAAKDTKEEVRE